MHVAFDLEAASSSDHLLVNSSRATCRTPNLSQTRNNKQNKSTKPTLLPAGVMTPTNSSSSVVATMRAALALLLLNLVAGQTGSCKVAVSNQYDVQISMNAYDGGDFSCLVPYDQYNVDAGACKSIGDYALRLGMGTR
jgi:hypothetical protein